MALLPARKGKGGHQGYNEAQHGQFPGSRLEHALEG